MHLQSVDAAAIGFNDLKLKAAKRETFTWPWKPAQFVHYQPTDCFVVVIVGQIAAEVIIEIFYSG